jgi:hypothetical protein
LVNLILYHNCPPLLSILLLSLRFLKPIIFRSSSTDSSHLTLGFPTHRVPSGLRTVSFLQGSSSCILQRCPSHSQYSCFYHFKYVLCCHTAYRAHNCVYPMT